MSKNLILAYHITQKSLAGKLKQVLSSTDANFEEVVASGADSDTDFYDSLSNHSKPILLLLSDNYLKAAETMHEALPNIQALLNKPTFKILVVPGVDVAGASSPTQFDRISHIIHYMNYWQDEYLAARQAGRKAGGLTEDMDKLIKTNREISTQVGELLRFLRDHDNWELSKMEHENYASLIDFFGLNGQANSHEKISESSQAAVTSADFENITEHEILEVEEVSINVPDEEQIEVEVPIAQAEILQMDSSREEIEEVPAYEADAIALQSSLDVVNDLIDNNDLESAKILLDEMVDSYPDKATVWSRLGLLAETENDFLQAGTHYSKALELDPTVPELDFKLGMIISSYHPDQIDRALKHFKQAVQKNPGHTEAHYQMAVLLNEKLENPQEAIPVFQKVLKLDPGHEFANYDLALVYFDQEDKQKARSYYIDAFKNNPELRTSVNDQAFDLQYSPAEAVIVEPEAEVKEEVASREVGDPEAVEQKVKDSKPPAAVKTQRPEIVIAKPTAQLEVDPKTAAPGNKDIKTVMITGATSGIGRATALAFIEAGYRVIITGRRAERLSDFITDLPAESKPAVRSLAFDVRNLNACQNALSALPAAFQDIDILINNAGLASGFDPIHKGKIEDWEKMIDTNIKGILFITRLISPGMVKRKSGHIINICSSAGHEVYPKGNVYCATKYAVDGLTKGMRLDLYQYNIRVSQVSPGHVEETEFAKVRFHGDENRAKIYEDFNPLKSADVANSIFFIATQPPHVCIQDIVLMGTQQANNMNLDRSGRKYDR